LLKQLETYLVSMLLQQEISAQNILPLVAMLVA
jgi:hypothetical protein